MDGQVLVVLGPHAGLEQQGAVLRRAAVVGLAGELARELLRAAPAVRVVVRLRGRREVRVGDALGAGRVDGHIVGVAADEGSDFAQELVALLPGTLGGDTIAGHLVEPVDGLFGVAKDVFGLLGHVVRAEEELEDEDGGGLRHVVREAPPGGDLKEADGIGLVGDEVEHAARGGHAEGGGRVVEVFGFVRLVGDPPVDSAEAWSVDDDFGAEVAEAKTHALTDKLLVALLLREVKDGRKSSPPFL